ncbi:uncharacterized protein K444DRAFT_623262 [Hyaloscypha bicolor E]|uniref:Uncharacterized protein n=1 Tax=Hyaloscypha bicolor E TaxID=1095630 RepID=A0A2J6TVJ1_9HELO|nr:uncharacterized protein K444DRAFT_623262 [Hyaloscypha bicolor E]PMD67027.1 hypothetical protein K444DRAFT_623262 [Hyaloscypha bicolor E]
MESACKTWVTFYYICGHVEERPVKHRKQCKAVHCHSLPPNIPPVDFPLEQTQPETRHCKKLELVVTISHSTCSRCLDKSTSSIAPISQPLLGERRTRWSNYQKEVQNICKEMADRRFKARQERDAADKDLDPWERHSGPDRFRRFRSWIRWVREQDPEGEEVEFSDLDKDSNEETAEEHERLPCADGCKTSLVKRKSLQTEA